MNTPGIKQPGAWVFGLIACLILVSLLSLRFLK